jgi:DNA (cytosine-5)-methyltransferase 1
MGLLVQMGDKLGKKFKKLLEKLAIIFIKAQGGQYTGPFSWENRRFSIAELKRLQTIPDEYQIVGNRQVSIEQIGNSVPSQLGRILALSILEQVIGIEFPFSISYLSQEQKLGFRQRKRQLTEIYSEKAKAAITDLKRTGKFLSVANSQSEAQGEIIRFLSKDFAWTKEPTTDSTIIYITYNLNDSGWLIKAGINKSWSQEEQFVIEIYPSCNDNEWDLGTNSVKLVAQDLDTRVFTSLWKAFEENLVDITGKADLVQLSGYYQYKSRISGIMTFNPRLNVNPLWRVIQCVTTNSVASESYICHFEGGERKVNHSIPYPNNSQSCLDLTGKDITRYIGIANQLSAKELAEWWDVKTEDVFFYLQSLRSIGYEVRNHNTNPQIPEGDYLIPYAFPTLNPKSVQLRKIL